MAYFQPSFTDQTTAIPYYGAQDFFEGYELNITGATTFTLNPGIVRGMAMNLGIEFNGQIINSPAVLEIDISTVGALGCYPVLPVLTIDTALPVYMIGDSSGANAPTAIVATADNFLPPGYDTWRRVAPVYINYTNNNIYAMVQSGSGTERSYVLASALVGVTASSATTLTAIDFSAGILPCNPAFTSKVLLTVSYNPAAATDTLGITPLNVTGNPYPITLQTNLLAVAVSQMVEVAPLLTPANTEVYFINSASGDVTSIWLSGWTESYNLRAV